MNKQVEIGPWEEIQAESWPEEFEKDDFNKARWLEEDRFAKEYEKQQREDWSADEMLKVVCPELFGDLG